MCADLFAALFDLGNTRAFRVVQIVQLLVDAGEVAPGYSREVSAPRGVELAPNGELLDATAYHVEFLYWVRHHGRFTLPSASRS